MLNRQLDIFSGSTLRDEGINQAVQHADRVNEEWSVKAYRLFEMFVIYSTVSYQFMMEDFREYAKGEGLPDPPSLRAFGFITIKAVKAGLIKKVDIRKVKNPKAHSANATVWQKV